MCKAIFCLNKVHSQLNENLMRNKTFEKYAVSRQENLHPPLDRGGPQLIADFFFFTICIKQVTAVMKQN